MAISSPGAIPAATSSITMARPGPSTTLPPLPSTASTPPPRTTSGCWGYTNSLGLFHLDMLSPTDGWATGQSESGPTIAHLYSGTFVTVTDPLDRVFLNGIDMLSPYEGWIVGEEGATLYYTCPLTFTDVQPADYFYEPVHYLTCAGIISHY